jgi:6-phosphogluconolactonase (cycloisomerase 2 family)
MALQLFLSGASFEVFRRRWLRCAYAHAPCFLLVLSAALTGAVSLAAQNPQRQYVYASVPVTTTASEVAGFSKDGGTGVLSSIGTPLADALEGGAMTVDAKGRFLFIVNPNSNGISMFQIDPATGALSEVFGSPFAAGPTANSTIGPSSPICLTTESSGQFLYVGYGSGNSGIESAILVYQIDSATPALVAPSAGAGRTDISSPPIGMVTDPKGLFLYVGLGPNSALGTLLGSANVYPIDTQSGELIGPGSAGNLHPRERAMAIDPQGRFLFDGWGTTEGFIESAPISPADGTATPVTPQISLGTGNFPFAMLAESSGRFLYVQENSGAYVYPIDPTTGALGQAQGPLPALNFQTRDAAADPQGPYVYSLQPNGINGFQVDPQLGGLSPLPGSPFTVGPAGGQGGIAISGAPVQAVSGPVAAIFPSSEDFGGVVVGQFSNTRMVSLTNTGDLLLTLSQVAVSGAGAGDFSAVPNCQLPAPLAANATCSISVIFKPTAAGLRQASLTTFDNAGGGMQSIALSGTGVAPEPAVTMQPGSVSFPSTAQGATSTAQTVTVTSTGAASLHISSVLVGGANPADFVVTGNCNGTFPVSANCSLGISFSPLGDGLRTATVLIADDAPGSPQSVELSGTGIGPPVARPGVTLSPSALLFPATTVGTAVGSQTVTVTSTGNSPVQISSIILGGANPGDFKMTDSCTPPASYAVHASCVLTLIFTPAAAGTRTATITITDDAPNSPQIIGVTGSANPVLVVGAAAGGGLTATVSPGQTANYNLQLVPGFTGSVSLGCGGAPPAATCMVPPSMKVTSGVGVPFSVTVATSGTGALMPFSNASRFAPQMLSCLAMPFMLLAMVLIMCGLHGTQKTARSGRVICGGALAGFAVMAMFAATGCGGGSSIAQSVPVTQPSVTATPAGTYTITLTPTATTTSGTALAAVPPTQLTLIVN